MFQAFFNFFCYIFDIKAIFFINNFAIATFSVFFYTNKQIVWIEIFIPNLVIRTFNRNT